MVPTKRYRCEGFPRWLILLLALGSGSLTARAQNDDGDSPTPIQRILVPPSRVAKELEKVQQGALIPWPVHQLDARLDIVRKAMQAREQPPRLAQAKYSAELIGSAFTQGNGQWLIQNPTGAPALLPITPFNLAVGKLRWEQGNDALVGEFDGKKLSLLVPATAPLDKAGRNASAQTCIFDWSSRGVPVNDGLNFSLNVPACPVTTLDLKLPTDTWLAAPKSTVLVHGPLDSGSPNHRLWKVHAAGQTQIDLHVGRITEPKGPAPTLFARVQSVQALERDRITLMHEFQVEILHGSVSELFLETDHALQPIDVSIKSGEVKRWQWMENAAPKNAKNKSSDALGVLRIEFHQPVQGKLQGLRVRSLAALSDNKVWNSPDLRVRGALTRGESLQLQFHADLPLGKWDAGTFQATQVSTDTDGRQTLTLADTAANASTSRRPVLILEHANVLVHTIEDYVWQITPRGATLQAEIQFLPSRGSLFELSVKMPKPFMNYSIESLQLLPDGALRNWRLQGDTLFVELKQALTPTKKVVVKIQLRQTAPATSAAPAFRTLAYPELEPTDATRREGTVTVRVAPTLQARLLSSSLPPSADAGAIAEKTPAGPTFHFSFRDQRLRASVRVTPLPERVQLRGVHSVRLSDARAMLTSRWEVEPLAGEPEYLDFQCSPAFPAAWKLLADENAPLVHHWERLHDREALPSLLMFGMPSGIHAAVLHSALPTGPVWRFHLAEPLRKKGAFTIEASLPDAMREDDFHRLALTLPNTHLWERVGGAIAADMLPRSVSSKLQHVPFMTPAQTAECVHEIVVESIHEPIERFNIQGFERASAATVPTMQAPLQTLTLHAAGRLPSVSPELMVTTRTLLKAMPTHAMCDEASVATFVHSDGRTDHRVQFRLWHWRDRTFTIGVPAGFRVETAKIYDHLLDRVDVREDAKGVRLTLPFDQNSESVRYEIFLRGQSGETRVPGLLNVQIPQIVWPADPLQIKTRFSLAKGLVPLSHESLASIGTPERFAGTSATWRWMRSLWTTGRSWLPFGIQVQGSEGLNEQRRTVLFAARQFSTENNRAMTLGEALEIFATNHLKEQFPLVIDRTAFRSLGIGAETLLPVAPSAGRPFWEGLGLIYVPTYRGALLSSSHRLRQFGIDGPADVDALDPPMREAILHGQDSSASFAAVLGWLKNSATESDSSPDGVAFAVSTYGSDFQEMTQWRILANPSREMRVMVLESWTMRLVGWIIACLAAVALVFLHRRLHIIACGRTYMLMLAATLLIAIWSPFNVCELLLLPTVGVLTIGMGWAVIRLFGQRELVAAGSASTVSKLAVGGGATLLLLLGIGYSISAQPLAPRTYSVLIVDGEKPLALLTPDLVAKFDELENRTTATTHGPVLVAVKYDGTVKEGIAHFDAVYDLQSTRDQDTLILPLAGVQLLDQSFLDGTAVFPTANKSGYAIPIPGKGSHQLRLSFLARVTASDDHLDLRFSVPKLVRNKLTLHWVKPVQSVHCLYCWGEELRTINVGSAVSKWEGQLGYESIVHLRWTGAALKPSANTIEVKEAHFWDLRADALSLSSSLQYAIGKNSLGLLSIALPEGLHVRFAEVHAITLPVGFSTPISMKKWYVTGKGAQRRLIVEFVQPISGNIVIYFEMMPQNIVVQQQLSLPLPAPTQGKSISGLLGYRLDATELRTTVQNLSVQGMNVADFEQAWKKQNPRTPISPPSRAYNFQRKSPQAGLELLIQTAVRQAEFDLDWKLDLHHADLLGKVAVTSPFEDITMLEFSIDPSLTLADVIGPEVRRWSLSDSNLQVWLRSNSKRVTMELVGWRELPYKPGPPSKWSFKLPSVYPLHVQKIIGTVALTPAPGLAIDNEQLRRLRPMGDEKNHYEIEDTPYEGSFEVRTPAKTAQAQILTKVERTDQGLAIAHGVRITTERGSLPGLTIHVKNWLGEPCTIEAPGAVIQTIKTKAPGTFSWSVKFPPGLPDAVSLVIRGRIVDARFVQVAIPPVELAGLPVESSYLVWKDVDCVQAETSRKITPQAIARSEVARLHLTMSPRDLLGWNVAKAPRTLKVVLPKSVPRADVQVMSARQTVHQDDRGQWIHKMTCWVHSAEPAELRFRFPAKLEQLAAWMDERFIPLRNTKDDEHRLPLPAMQGPRFVQLRWKYAAALEPESAPSFTPLPLELPPTASNSLMLWIPPGQVAATSSQSANPTFLEYLLAEAETHIQISALLALEANKVWDRPSNGLLTRQQQFYACVRQAEFCVKSMANQASDFDASVWQREIDALIKKNRDVATERGYERQRESAEKAKPVFWTTTPFRTAGQLGTPWKLTPNHAGPKLQSAQAEADAERRSRTEWLLLASVFLLVFSYFRHGISVLASVAPELVLAVIVVFTWSQGASLLSYIIAIWMLLIRGYRLRMVWKNRASTNHRLAAKRVPSTGKLPHDLPAPPAS